ncbi:hypothetical protein HG535_0F03830 [Zygotorulaspora mrakii]|uniref:RRM domain-containing protein n=1 Tax=Zygotorulaspora mrakii TaxID=42260 RepID=A0A7H9B822_ZYGMR|nr:uncharacterized protein HG535_0F03830 [Zygotorulaspora mrakii]QLG73872.1 hypothetical protein HG535_0F03830 [Zygotorulaspora mrakii]
MNHNISKFPPDVSKLFKARPPLQYKRQVDYPLEKRQTNPHITGVSHLLGSQLNEYRNRFSEGSSNEHIKEYEKAVTSKINELRSLDEKLKNWEPNNDPNIKHTDPYRTIFVGRLSYEVNEVELQKEFIKFGEIEKVRVVRDKITNKSRGYAFVVFTNPQSSKLACKEIGVHRGLEIGGRTCIVDIERGRTVKYFKPRRLGGGLGGRGYTKMYRKSDRPFRRPVMERDPVILPNPKTFPTRPVYTGPSRFSRSPASTQTASSMPSNRYGANAGQEVPPVQTSYRSRNARAQESNKVQKTEEPDY